MVQEGSLLLIHGLSLMKCGLYCNILVKTAQKGFPKEFLNKTNLSRGKWVTFSDDVKGVKVQENNF